MGRGQLARSAGYQRLVVVTLHREHLYGGVEEVKAEVAGKALELGQDGLPQQKKVCSVRACSVRACSVRMCIV